MKCYSIYDAKARLSELIRFVKTKGPVIITDRGVPVVQVMPVPQADQKTGLFKRLEMLRDLGLSKKATAPISKVKPIRSKRGALKRFLESRDE